MNPKSTPPRILLLGPERHAVSGVATHLTVLLNSTLGRDFDLKQFTLGSEGREKGRLLRGWRLLSLVPRLLWQLLRWRPDVVHINSSLNQRAFWRDALLLLLLRPLPLQLLWQSHGGDLQHWLQQCRRFAPLVRWLLRRPDAVVVLNRHEYQSYRALQLRRLWLIPNAIDLHPFESPPVPRRHHSHWRLLYIGRLAAEKGLIELITALTILRQQAPLLRWHCWIAGSGPLQALLQRQIRQPPLQGRVRLLGVVQGAAKVRLWRAADLFLFPSYHVEGLPYATLESLASGTPLLTTAVGGNSDAVRSGREGVVIEPHQPQQWAQQLQQLLQQPAQLRQMSAACRLRAAEQYGVERLAWQFDALYRELLSTHDPKTDRRAQKRVQPTTEPR